MGLTVQVTTDQVIRSTVSYEDDLEWDKNAIKLINIIKFNHTIIVWLILAIINTFFFADNKPSEIYNVQNFKILYNPYDCKF